MQRKLDDIVTGYIAGYNIPLMLHNQLDTFLRFRYIVISCMDSDPNVSNMKNPSRELLTIGCNVEELGTLLRVGVDKNALNYITRTFTGFDELWFFEAIPNITSPPPSITSDRSITDTTDPFVVDTLNTLPDWMRTSKCAIGLGDGAGLNFVTATPAMQSLMSIYMK